ncbi:hypothetical protein D3C81_1559220 [compost metagenome]
MVTGAVSTACLDKLFVMRIDNRTPEVGPQLRGELCRARQLNGARALFAALHGPGAVVGIARQNIFEVDLVQRTSQACPSVKHRRLEVHFHGPALGEVEVAVGRGNEQKRRDRRYGGAVLRMELDVRGQVVDGA